MLVWEIIFGFRNAPAFQNYITRYVKMQLYGGIIFVIFFTLWNTMT